MAKLFKNKAIQKDLEKFEIPNFEEKVGIVKKWLEAYQNKTLHQKTESQCEQAFNQSFFVELLGYTTFPNETYTIDPKANTEASGQKPDAALGYYSSEKSRTLAVVEIKDVNTALDRSQKREGNLSPVQQAFKYKPQFKECVFVIATNFYEIRLHKDTQLDYEQFTLESLANPKNDYFELRKFYYLLCAENLISKTGKSKTENLLSDIRVDQEKITKKFYQEYKLLRQELIKDIITHNSIPRSELMLIIEKAQKVIDRIVFVCFCEDTDLLPENTLQTVIKHTENSFSNHWDTLKGFFNAIDKGSEKLEIPHGYNGGLFAEDEKLNNLKISDKVCQKFLELGKYDFSEDLSVNILGHIFEQSISDIEEIKAKALEGEEADKKKSKRKKDGIFYTPDYIVDYIVKNSLGKYLEEKELEIKEKNNLKEDILDENYKKRALATYLEYQTVLHNVKVLDPACGSGAFLVKVFDYLLAENKRVANIIADLNNDNIDLFSSENYIKSLLENNIYGVDLNPESVEITKLSLWLKSAQKNRKLVNLKGNIKCGNSLIDDPEVAGERAFKWEDEFKEIMDAGGFDVIVGNPPYIRIQGLKEFQNKESEYYERNYRAATGKYDIYTLFIEKALKLNTEKGKTGYILPHKFLIAEFGTGIRKYMSEKHAVESLIHFGSEMVFEDASTYTCILTLSKGNNYLKFAHTKPTELQESIFFNTLSYKELNDLPWQLVNNKESEILNKINSKKLKLKDILNGIYQGVVTIGDDIYILTGNIDGRIFKGYSERLATHIELEANIIRPLLKGDDVKRYSTLEARKYVIYPHFIDNQGKTKPILEDDFRATFPKCYKYLEQFKDELRKKKIRYKTNPEHWYALHRSRELSMFKQEKIITPYASIRSQMTLDDAGILHNTKCYSLILKENSNIDYEYLLGILNSALMWFFIRSTGNVLRGGFYTYTTKSLEEFGVSKSTNQKQIISKVRNMTVLKRSFENNCNRFLSLIEAEHKLENITKKLEKFYELDFESFIKEIKAKNLSLDKKSELLDFFEKSKKEILRIKSEIDSTDKEIDDMVFDLYGLTEEERQIVLND